MKISISKILIVFALLISSIFFTANISASYEDEYAEIRQNMEELGISEDNQDAILNKLEKGILPDSLLGDNSKITSINKETVGNKETVTTLFEDGSISKDIIIKTPSVAPRDRMMQVYNVLARHENLLMNSGFTAQVIIDWNSNDIIKMDNWDIF